MSDKPQGLGMFQSVPGEYEAYNAATTNECPVSGMAADFKPFSEEYLADPYVFFRRARAEEPVFFSAPPTRTPLRSKYWAPSGRW